MDNNFSNANNHDNRRSRALSSVQKLTFLEKLKRQPIFREKILYTVSLCWSFIMLGWVESLIGPTFPDLRLIIHESLDTSSWLFTATSGGFLVGSVITGALYERYNKLLLLVLSILGTAGTVAAIPWCRYFPLMMFVKFAGGMAASCLDTGGNAEMVNTWKHNSASYMQALHFCFSLGGMIAPLMAQPFLATRLMNIHIDMNSTLTDITNTSIHNDSSSTLSTPQIYSINNQSFNSSVEDYASVEIEDEESNMAYSETKVQYAYMISACLMLMTTVPYMCMHYSRGRDLSNRPKENKRKEPMAFHSLSLSRKILILTLLSSMMVLYCGTEDTFAGFLMTFTISQLHWSKKVGSIATSVYWMSFGFARLGAIFTVRLISTTKLLIIFSTMMVVSFSCFLAATLAEVTTLIWICIGLSGVSMSVVFPAIFTWTNNHVVSVSGKMSAMFMTSASLGVMLFPILFGYTMEHYSPIWFLYLLIGQSILWVLIFTVVVLTRNAMLKHSNHTIEIEIEEKHRLKS